MYCAGGVSREGRPVTAIERYVEETRVWQTIDLPRLEGNWTGMSVYKYCPTGVILFGGNKAFKVSVGPIRGNWASQIGHIKK